MNTIITYKSFTGGTAVQAIIASSRIIFITDGEAKLFPEKGA
ncbi:hypothetical protein ACTHGU_17750 [Chitinophagaceae bacterium MMS25-I14]